MIFTWTLLAARWTKIVSESDVFWLFMFFAFLLDAWGIGYLIGNIKY